MAGYFYKSLEKLVEAYPQIEVKAICRKADPNAPFQFPENERITLFNREDFDEATILQLLTQLEPNLIYLSGWIDEAYMKACRIFREKNIPVIMGIDNPWEGSMRQQLGVFLKKGKIKAFASHIWIPGAPHYELARQLGFQGNQILQGVYVADTEQFVKSANEQASNKSKNYPHKILFLGRLVPYKRPLQLATCFHNLGEKASNWELVFVGNGPLKSEIEKLGNPKISIRDFVQPDQLPQLLQEFGLFCLPSAGEHWGVVVQEAAAAGLPLITSSSCGAASAFIIHNHNGFIYDVNSISDLEVSLRKAIEMDDRQLIEMGLKSKILAEKLNHDYWIANLLSPIENR